MAKAGSHLTEEQRQKIREAQLALRRGKPEVEPIKHSPKPEEVEPIKTHIPKAEDKPSVPKPEKKEDSETRFLKLKPEEAFPGPKQALADQMKEQRDIAVKLEKPRTFPKHVATPSKQQYESEALKDFTEDEKLVFLEQLSRYHIPEDTPLFQAEARSYKALQQMEQLPFKVDTQFLLSRKMELATRLDGIIASLQQSTQTADPTTPKSIVDILNKHNIPFDVTKKGAPSLKTEFLRKAGVDYKVPELELLAEYKEKRLQLSHTQTFLASLRNNTVSTHFDSYGTTTGRVYSDNVNLQGLPEENRKAILPSEGNEFWSVDYKAQEPRIMAALSGQRDLVEAFNKGKDVYKAIMSKITGLPEDQITPEMRSVAKVVVISMSYGASPFGLAKTLGIDESQAKQIMDKYFESNASLKEFIDNTREASSKSRKAISYYGREWHIPEEEMEFNKDQVLRQIPNFVAQATGADLLKFSVSEFSQKQEALGLKMRLPLHDAILFEVPKNADKAKVAESIKRIMEKNVAGVKMEVEISIGDNWGSVAPIQL